MLIVCIDKSFVIYCDGAADEADVVALSRCVIFLVDTCIHCVCYFHRECRGADVQLKLVQ